MQSHLTTPQIVSALATFVNRDDAGRHFTEAYPDALLDELERLELIAIDRPVHAKTGIPWGHEHWTAEVTPAGVELVEAYPEYHPGAVRAAVVEQAKRDAAAFVAEFGEVLDPEATDWDATAWGEVEIEGAEDLWDAYQEALVAETERLVDEATANRKPGLHATADSVYAVMPSGRAWIVASPDRDGVEEIAPADIPANATPADDLAGADSAEYYAAVEAASGESFAGVKCPACGESKPTSEMVDSSTHNTDGETICLACHREIIAGDSDLDCPGCR